MSKENAKERASDTPRIKPWCYRVGRTGAKKFGARENWPLEWREQRTPARRARSAKRAEPGDEKVEDLHLIAQCKAGGIEGQIARAMLRARKMERHVTAENMRREIYERLMRLQKQRERSAPGQGGKP